MYHKLGNNTNPNIQDKFVSLKKQDSKSVNVQFKNFPTITVGWLILDLSLQWDREMSF